MSDQEPTATESLPGSVIGSRCRASHLTLVIVSAALIVVALNYSTIDRLRLARTHLHDFLESEQFELTPEALVEDTFLTPFGWKSEYALLKYDFDVDASQMLLYVRNWRTKANDELSRKNTLLDMRVRAGCLNRSRVGFKFADEDSAAKFTARVNQVRRVTWNAPTDPANAKPFERLLSPRIVHSSFGADSKPSLPRSISSSSVTTLRVEFNDGTAEDVAVTLMAAFEPGRLNFGVLDPFLDEIDHLSVTDAYSRLNERLFRETDYITLLNVHIPKPLFATCSMIAMYILLFDIAIWVTALAAAPSQSQNAAGVPSWSLVVPGLPGLLGMLSTILVLPCCAALCSALFFHRTEFDWSTCATGLLCGGIATLSLVCVSGLMLIRGDNTSLRRRLSRLAPHLWIAMQGAGIIPMFLLANTFSGFDNLLSTRTFSQDRYGVSLVGLSVLIIGFYIPLLNGLHSLVIFKCFYGAGISWTAGLPGRRPYLVCAVSAYGVACMALAALLVLMCYYAETMESHPFVDKLSGIAVGVFGWVVTIGELLLLFHILRCLRRSLAPKEVQTTR